MERLLMRAGLMFYFPLLSGLLKGGFSSDDLWHGLTVSLRNAKIQRLKKKKSYEAISTLPPSTKASLVKYLHCPLTCKLTNYQKQHILWVCRKVISLCFHCNTFNNRSRTQRTKDLTLPVGAIWLNWKKNASRDTALQENEENPTHVGLKLTKLKF